jgi:aspartyl-tRNA(Asn)/glutamyl-tRNA(Gln) amidotransferase subunit C
MSISKEEIQHLADLAKIEITDTEADKYRDELGDIIDYAEKLDELDLEDVPATTHSIEIDAPLRDDNSEHRLSQDQALQNAPDSEDGQFRVPNVVED